MRMQTRQRTSNGRSKRAATAISDKLWPNATIPYVFGNVTGRFDAHVRRNNKTPHSLIALLTRTFTFWPVTVKFYNGL